MWQKMCRKIVGVGINTCCALTINVNNVFPSNKNSSFVFEFTPFTLKTSILHSSSWTLDVEKIFSRVHLLTLHYYRDGKLWDIFICNFLLRLMDFVTLISHFPMFKTTSRAPSWQQLKMKRLLPSILLQKLPFSMKVLWCLALLAPSH